MRERQHYYVHIYYQHGTLRAGTTTTNAIFESNFSSGANPAIHVQSLLLLLPSIRQADALVRRFWSNVASDGTVTLNKLLLEMLGDSSGQEMSCRK